MDKYKDTYKNICRVCLSYENSNNFVSLVNVKSNNGELSCYGKAVSTFAHISIKKGDNLPTMMCQKCLLMLKQAIRFKLTCELSQERLEKLTEQFVNKTITDKNIRGIITQYVLFSHYFPDESIKESSDNNISTKKLKESQKKSKIEHSNFQANDHSNDSNIPEEDCVNNFEMTLSDENSIDEVFSKLEQIAKASHGNEKRIKSESMNYVNNIFQDKDEKTERTLSDDDSGDELLKQMDKIITEMSYPSVNDYEQYKKRRKRIKARKIQARRLFVIRSRLLSRKMQYQISTKKKKENFLCKVCHKVLANQHTYNHHMQIHNGFRYMCEHCGKGFPILAEMQRHQLVRHDIGPYLQCQHCSYKAPRKLNLIEHVRLHTGERPYTCDKCGLTFRRRAIWRKHMVYHGEKTVQCSHCPRKFFRISEMQAHANSIHERMYVYLCHKCDATYAKTETVRRHLTEKHGIPREMQGKILRINKGRITGYSQHEQ